MQINLDEIVSIKKIGKRSTIDINVSGDNLFFANDILTHNSGFTSSDIEMTDVSESFGTAATADMILAIIRTEELDNLNQIMIKQLKNRYSDKSINKRFVVGIDRAKMRLYDCEQSAQDDILDNNSEEEYDYEDEKPKKTFEGFKF